MWENKCKKCKIDYIMNKNNKNLPKSPKKDDYWKDVEDL
jgi:hypothetical protein